MDYFSELAIPLYCTWNLILFLTQTLPQVRKEQVVQDVSKMLSKAGFKLKSKDTEISDIVDRSVFLCFQDLFGLFIPTLIV